MTRDNQISESGHSFVDIVSGYGWIVGGTSQKKSSIFCLLNASLRELFIPFTCLTNTLLSFCRLFNVSILINFIHWWHLELKLLTMWTTEILSQKTITLDCQNLSAQVIIPAHKANNFRNLMLGLYFLMKPGSQMPKIQWFPQITPYAKDLAAEASE